MALGAGRAGEILMVMHSIVLPESAAGSCDYAGQASALRGVASFPHARSAIAVFTGPFVQTRYSATVANPPEHFRNCHAVTCEPKHAECAPGTSKQETEEPHFRSSTLC